MVDDISSLRDEWARFERDVDEFDIQHAQGQGKFAFDFVEGPLVKAIRSGDWCVAYSSHSFLGDPPNLTHHQGPSGRNQSGKPRNARMHHLPPKRSDSINNSD